MTKSHFIWLSLFLHFSSSIHCLLDESLDAILEDHAFRVMTTHQRPRTGALYNAALPANLAGMKVSVVGLRTTTLWRKGANFSGFVIPPKTLPIPYVRRLVIIYHNLGNWSSLYYTLPGYSIISPVVGFLVYDASSHLSSGNFSKIELSTIEPISIEFQKSNLMGQGKQRMHHQCALFGDSGQVLISEMSTSANVCYSRNRGHFSIVVPLEKTRKKKMWPFWVVGGFVGVVLVGLGGVVAVRSSLVGKRAQGMEREADEGECLETYWIGSSKFPRGDVTRTHPVLETTSLPNPKLSWYA